MKYAVALALLALVKVSAVPTTVLAIEPENQGGLVDSSGRALCEVPGIILTPRNVLVPAHCVDGMPVFSLNFAAGGQQVSVARSEVHENWNPISPGTNDAAVLDLAQELELSVGVQAIAPQTQSDLNQALQTTTRYLAVSEWIYTKIGGEDGGGSPPMICP